MLRLLSCKLNVLSFCFNLTMIVVCKHDQNDVFYSENKEICCLANVSWSLSGGQS